MLNPFPIQFLAPLAYFLLRVCVGFILIRLGKTNIKLRVPTSTISDTHSIPFPSVVFLTLGVIEIAIGILCIIGFSTQIAALCALIISLLHILKPQKLMHDRTPSRIFFVLLFITSLSLFITGAGAFAIDLPI